MRKSLVLAPALLLLALSISPRPALAWNATGHEVVALIAWDQLTPSAKAKITTLLKSQPDYTNALTRETTPAGDERDTEAFAIAATWPDLIRSASFGKSHLLEHSGWHYADSPYAVGGVTPSEEPPVFTWSKGVEPTNAIQALKKVTDDLKDPALQPTEKAIALSWLEHLVGDIHQPLHAVSRFSPELPTGDKGGNSFTINNAGQVGNLHSLWDAMLGGFMDLSKVKDTVKKLEVEHPKSEFTKELAITNYDVWAHESFEQAKTYVYLNNTLPGSFKPASRAKTAPPVPTLPSDYIAKSTTVAGRNAALAGYRLANILNEIFTDKTP